jgi:hypothetical protein
MLNQIQDESFSVVSLSFISFLRRLLRCVYEMFIEYHTERSSGDCMCYLHLKYITLMFQLFDIYKLWNQIDLFLLTKLEIFLFSYRYQTISIISTIARQDNIYIYIYKY